MSSVFTKQPPSVHFNGYAQQALGMEPYPPGKNPIIDPKKVLFTYEEFKFLTNANLSGNVNRFNRFDEKINTVERAFLVALNAQDKHIPDDIQNTIERYVNLQTMGWLYTYANKNHIVIHWDREAALQLPLSSILNDVRELIPEYKVDIWLYDQKVEERLRQTASTKPTPSDNFSRQIRKIKQEKNKETDSETVPLNPKTRPKLYQRLLWFINWDEKAAFQSETNPELKPK